MRLVHLLLLLAVTACVPGFGQPRTEPSLAFDVVSIKPVNQDAMQTAPVRSVGRITWTTDLGYLISYAYRLQPNRLSGAIPGSDRAIFQLNATTPPGATEDQVRLMVRTLLTERFKMKAHMVTKDGDRYVLSVARNGPRLKEAKPDEVPSASDGRAAATQESASAGKITGWKASMTALCEALQRVLGMVVVDETGLKGNYDFSIRYARPDQVAETDEPTLFAALQRELGLKLEKGKGPVATLVVDHIEVKPTEN